MLNPTLKRTLEIRRPLPCLVGGIVHSFSRELKKILWFGGRGSTGVEDLLGHINCDLEGDIADIAQRRVSTAYSQSIRRNLFCK